MDRDSQIDQFQYDCTNIHVDYDKSRELPSEIVDMWMSVLLSKIDKDGVDSILDLGCGTGRFTKPLAEYFDAFVHGVDPSAKMLQVAMDKYQGLACDFAQGSTDEIPLDDGVIDLAFMSMVYHHVQDKGKAIDEVRRVLKRSGKFCIRNSTIESMDSYYWLQFFPAACDIELGRVPRQQDILDIVSARGFEVAYSTSIQQEFAANTADYTRKIGLRGLSSLKAISDSEFAEGIKNMDEFLRTQDVHGPIFESIDLFIFSVDG